MKSISLFSWAHRLGDAIIIFGALWSVAALYGVPWADPYTIAALTGVLAYSTFAQFLGLYEGWRGRSLSSSLNLVFIGWLLAGALIIIYAFATKQTEDFSRVVMIGWLAIVPFFLAVGRWAVRWLLEHLRQRGFNHRRVALIGAGQVATQLSSSIRQSPWLGMDLVDEFSIQDAHTCVSKARSGGFDLLYIALPLRDEAVIRFLLDALADSSVVVKYAPDLLGFELLHSSWSDINGIPVVHLQDSPIRGMSALLKCLEDVVLSLVILLLISPVLILTALAIKLTSSGPVLFKQTRYGLNGKPIKVWKFRSMTVCEDGAISQATKNDVRVTRVGAFIRRTSIDEMPQFFNVLGGSMSIVGPRPHAVVHNEEFRKIAPSYMRRHLVKPGITGWAQVNGWRGETDSEEKILKRTEFDLYYIQHWSIWFDIKIVFLTILKGFFNQNAY